MYEVLKNAVASVTLLILCGCATKRTTGTTIDSNASDSVRVEVRERIVLVPDTVYIDIPLQTAERITLSDSSHLENDYAESDARINPDGTLYHRLATKEQKKSVPTSKTLSTKDSIAYRDRYIKQTKTETKTVERDFTSWERFRLQSWYWFALIVLGVVICAIKKVLFHI